MKRESVGNKFLSTYYNLIGSPGDFTIEHRFINVSSLLSATVAVMTLSLNLILDMGIVLFIASIISIVGFSLIFWIARYKGALGLAKWLIAGFLFILLSSFWFANNGSYGPVLHLFLVFFIFLMFIWEGPHRLIFILFYALNLSFFFYFEYYHNELIEPYPSETLRIIDNYTGYFLYVFVGGFIILSAKNNYLREKKNAEQSDKLKSAFLANMSHEIRTPMNAILGFSQLLEYDDLPVEEKKAFTGVIKENSESLLKLIEDIIDVSKIEAGQLKLETTDITIHDVFTELKQSFGDMLIDQQKSSVGLEYCEPQEALKFKTDEFRFRQIMNNLLSNAVKYTDEGFINFGYHVHNMEIHFYVKDTGTGIKTEDQYKIFEQFFKIEDKDTDKLFGGTGIGLSITKSLVELMRGRIWVDSEHLKGSTFWFALPYEQ